MLKTRTLTTSVRWVTDATPPADEADIDPDATEETGASEDNEQQDDPSKSLTRDEADDLVDAEPDARQSIGYSSQDFDVAGLVRRLRDRDIVVPTFGIEDPTIATAGFQRAFVWNRKQMDRFVESLLLGFPVPGIFLVRQADRRYLVLDGQQRLRTLQAFQDGLHAGREFALQNVVSELRGLTYRTLSDEQRRLLDDTFITATIVTTDGSRASLEAIYQVFERLNTGGTQLTPHEIRVALYAGEFVGFLETLNNKESWRAIYGKTSPRLRDQELILRILALYTDAGTYRRPLKSFLNGFLADHRNLQGLDVAQLEHDFDEACKFLRTQAPDGRLRWQGRLVNSAWTESLVVGLMRRIRQDAVMDSNNLPDALTRLRSDPLFSQSVTRATADEEAVRIRLERATVQLAEV